MSQLLLIISISWLAGFTAFIDSFIARLEKPANTEAKQELIYGIVALDGRHHEFCIRRNPLSYIPDIAPQAKMKNHWKPPLGAVLGFAIGMLGQNY